MVKVTGTLEWRATFPGAIIGLLEIAGVENMYAGPELNQRKRAVEAQLRKDYARYSRKDFSAHPVMAAYEKYYKRFNKTYHILLQVESIILKGKGLPDVSPLVDANFTAEVNTFVLTAGHDVEKLEAPIVIDISREGDEITAMNGETKPIRAGDMVMRDPSGICCSILYGQDNRSPISAGTRQVLYVAYAPPGVGQEAVEDQIQQIEKNIRLFAPRAVVEQSKLLIA